MTEDQQRAIEAHGNNLLAIFPNAKYKDPERICRALRRHEVWLSRWAELDCSEPIMGRLRRRYEREEDRRMACVRRLLGIDEFFPVFFNGDPRGYALKIEDSWMRSHPDAKLHQDWGGYGILAPEIGPKGNAD